MLNTNNYYSQVKADAKEYIENELIYILNENEDQVYNDLIDTINDTLWCADSVTGNGSGSYYFNRFEARENVLNNIEDVIQAFKDDDNMNTFANYIINEEWESIDVYTRCSVLYEAVSDLITDEEIETPIYVLNKTDLYNTELQYFETEEDAMKTAEEEFYYYTEEEIEELQEFEIVQCTISDIYNEELYKALTIKDFLNN